MYSDLQINNVKISLAFSFRGRARRGRRNFVFRRGSLSVAARKMTERNFRRLAIVALKFHGWKFARQSKEMQFLRFALRDVGGIRCDYTTAAGSFLPQKDSGLSRDNTLKSHRESK